LSRAFPDLQTAKTEPI